MLDVAFKLLYLLMVPGGALTLTAYDCEADTHHIGTFSLELEPTCDSLDIKNVSARGVQVLQERKLNDVRVKRCRISFSYLIYYCGFDSIPYLAASQLEGEMLNIDRSNCLNAINHGFIVTPYGNKKISGLTKSSEGTYNVNLMGTSTSSGKCWPISFNFRGTDYSNHIMKATYKITLFEESVSFNHEENIIYIGSGLEATYTTGAHFDARFGNYYWDINEQNCLTDAFDVLHEGPANVSQLSDGNRVLTIETNDFIFTAKIMADTRACGYVAFTTSIEGILIVFRSEGIFQFAKTSVDPKNIDIFRHLNAKLGYLFAREVTMDNSAFLKIARDICLLEYRQTRIAIEILMAFPDAHVIFPGMPPGSIAKLMGEVVSIFQCLPVKVDTSVFESCTREIPVVYNNMTMFVRPFSRMLSKEHSSVPCSADLAPTFKLGGKWRSYFPSPGPAPTPTPLLRGIMRNYTKEFDWSSVEKGLYPKQSLKQLQKIFTFGQRKDGIMARAAQSSFGKDDGDAYSIVNSLSHSDWSALSASLWNFLAPLERFGSWVSALLGCIAIINAFQYVGMVIWRFVRSPGDAGICRRISLALSGTAFFWWHAIRAPPVQPANVPEMSIRAPAAPPLPPPSYSICDKDLS